MNLILRPVLGRYRRFADLSYPPSGPSREGHATVLKMDLKAIVGFKVHHNGLALNVSQSFRLLAETPVLNHLTRWADVPCVNVSGTA